jgi:hypothetical protein
MKSFRQPINQVTADIPADAPDNLLLDIPQHVKKDLLVWAGFLQSDLKWFPLYSAINQPPIWVREFVSDAAGLPQDSSFTNRPGFGNVGFSEDGQVIFAYQFLWPKKFITELVDEKGVKFADKTTTLEMIGLLAPLLLRPELFKNHHVLMKVDCFGTVFGMQNRGAKGDKSASVFIRAAYLIAAFLGCSLHVSHLPRVSDWGAQVADRLSRLSSSSTQDKKLLSAFKHRALPECLHRWFELPVLDWNLAILLLDHVKTLV